MHTQSLNHVWFFAIPRTIAPQALTVHGIFQARILEWVAISSPRGSSRPRDRTRVSYISCIGRRILYHWATREASPGRWAPSLLATLMLVKGEVPSPAFSRSAQAVGTSVPRKFSLLSWVSSLLFLEHREIFCSMIVLEDATGPGPPDQASRRAVYVESKRSVGSRARLSVFPSCWGRWVSPGRITKSHFKNRPEKSESRDNQRFETHTPPSKPWQESKNKSGGASRPSSFETVAVADFENRACPS